MKTTILLIAALLSWAFRNQAQTVIDYDGNMYDTLLLGSQVWLKQNLKTTHNSTGSYISQVTDSSAWVNLVTGGRCYYNNDSSAMDSVYGPLYNWYAVMDPNLCPVGWHVPTNAEWQQLETFLGGNQVAGGAMKEAGTLHWVNPNTAATNSSGFSGLPGGCRTNTGIFEFIFENGLWWTSTSYNSSSAWGLYLWNQSPAVEHDPVWKKYGMSVRCMKNTNTGLEENHDDRGCSIYPNPCNGIFTIQREGDRIHPTNPILDLLEF
jgi:uncharacterized protein (TIGR02145 family)